MRHDHLLEPFLVDAGLREAAKSSFFSGPATKRGIQKILTLSTRGKGGGKALAAGPLERTFFFGFTKITW